MGVKSDEAAGQRHGINERERVASKTAHMKTEKKDQSCALCVHAYGCVWVAVSGRVLNDLLDCGDAARLYLVIPTQQSSLSMLKR